MRRRVYLPSNVTGLRIRYLDAHFLPMGEWTVIIGLPVPKDTASLLQKVPDTGDKIETWEYGIVAQIFHPGPYGQDEATVERPHKFIEDSGYEIDGIHEEKYLTRPDVKIPKTIIMYPVSKR
ncbi:hypothetical protein ACFLU0_00220 [Chloroflexota bacterium]